MRFGPDVLCCGVSYGLRRVGSEVLIVGGAFEFALPPLDGPLQQGGDAAGGDAPQQRRDDLGVSLARRSSWQSADTPID
jgi:hypothetical protein